MSSRSRRIVFLLLPDLNQKHHLTVTLKTFQDAAQFVCAESYTRNLINKVEIQPMVYATLRSDYGLPAQMAVRAISQGVDVHKAAAQAAIPSSRRKQNRFDLRNAYEKPIVNINRVPYDGLMYSFNGLHELSILCIKGREHIPIWFAYYAEPLTHEGPQRGELVWDSEANVFFFEHHIPASVYAEADASAGRKPKFTQTR